MRTIEDTVRAYFDAFEENNVDRLVGGFADDGVIMADGMGSLRGRSAIRAAFEGIFNAIGMECKDLVFDRVEDKGSWAIVESRSIEAVTNRSDNTVTEGQYRELFVLERAGDDWTITNYMFNRPTNSTAG